MTLSETRQVVSGSESIARRLRFEMEERAEEISRRGRDAEEGLAVWSDRITVIVVPPGVASDSSGTCSCARMLFLSRNNYTQKEN